jgi:two-component system, OmpR family, sensor histidine kinase ChvG
VSSRYAFSLRLKLALVSLTLLLIPWIGYRYLHAVEQYLRLGREAVLLERAHATAAVLADQAQVFAPRDADAAPDAEHLFVRPLRTPIQLDGYDDDWAPYRDSARSYAAEHVLYARGPYRPASLSFTLNLVGDGAYVYALFRVRDDKLVYRDASGANYDANDYVELSTQDRSGVPARYQFATSAPGWLIAQRIAPDESDTPVPEPRIKGEWQETRQGYNLELRIPQELFGVRLAVSVNDVDDAHTRVVTASLGTASAQHPEALNTVGVPTPQIQRWLRGLTPPGARTWVVDTRRRVVALEGGLKARGDENAEPAERSTAPIDGGVIHMLYRLVLTQPADEFQDDLSAASQLNAPDIIAALSGQDATRWRQTPDRRASILTAAAPVRANGAVVGAVAVEETSNGILILQNRALETLINTSVVALAIAAVVLLTFATRLSLRVRRLRDAAEAAIGTDGRIRDVTISVDARDELGDLARSFQGMLGRLAQYNRYLETMAGKLSHELRTPITVVRSSLENLDTACSDDERRIFSQRARAGIERLSGLLARMSEATRLEQTLQTEERSRFDLTPVVAGCVAGYRCAHPAQPIELSVQQQDPDQALTIHGAPDLIAQLLDKLVANARDFCAAGSTIDVRIESDGAQVTLSVANAGPQLPVAMVGQLFDSMVSVRAVRSEEPHLGLGLYIVRLIAEFHGGRAQAVNRSDGAGVIFSVTLPLS